MFSLAVTSLQNNSSLKKVVIMEHPPRFDTQGVDPTSIKPKLAKLANATLNQLRNKSVLKDKIVIGRHCLNSQGIGLTHSDRYESNQGKYDGVHFYGKNGTKDYTNSVKNILLDALPNAVMKDSIQSDHTRCPQARYQARLKYPNPVKTHNRFEVLKSNLGNY